MRKLFLLTAFLLCFNLQGCGNDKNDDNGGVDPPPPGPETFTTINEQGFTYQVSSLLEWTAGVNNGYRYVGKVLDDMITYLPNDRLVKMQAIPIRFTVKSDSPVIEYVPEAGDNHIAINKTAEFYDGSVLNRPWWLMAAFAESYYDRFLDGDAAVGSAYDQAVASGGYDFVDYFNGVSTSKREARALADAKSYFVELSVAYFGRNDYYPFDYHDIMEFDAAGFSLMESVWGARGLKNYDRHRLSGYSVMVPKIYAADAITATALTFLEGKLAEINEIVPKPFTDFFKRRVLWLDNTDEGAAAHHPSRQWLIQNGRFVEKYNCVELSNMTNFVDWCGRNQPLMVLHEYAHMYHWNSLRNDASILSAYDRAMNAGLYRNVEYYDGTSTSIRSEAYATTNEKEYFSEITEAYFGENDYFPFRRAQLESYDNVAFRLVERVWSLANYKE